MKFDPYSTLMINCSSCILIVFHLYCFIKPEAASQIVYDTYSECCEPCSFCNGNILSQNIIQVFCIFYLFILYTAVSRMVVGKTLRDNPERYFGWF